MKLYRYLLLFILLSYTQQATKAQNTNNWDEGIMSIRTNAVPDFRYKYDDYLQYSPAAVMLGLKACGYESRTGWGQQLVSDAFSIGIMAAAVNGIKYSVKRMRPDGSRRNSFPSGHTATSFMTATLLYKEYGWRSPWFSIGGYTVATASAVSRVLNNKHWMTDLVGGAAVGIGSVHLGYYLTDLIFKDRHLSSYYERPSFYYDNETRHYTADIIFGYRFIVGADPDGPVNGGFAGISSDIDIAPGIGATARIAANSLSLRSGLSDNLYSALAGAYYNWHFARRFELQAKAMAGYAWAKSYSGGADIAVGAGLSIFLDSNFKIKAFADFETFSLTPQKPWLKSVLVGYSAAWFW